MLSPIGELIPLMLEARRFFELGIPSEGEKLDPIQKGVLSRLTVHWYSRTNIPGKTSSKLIQALDHCKKSPENKAIGRLIKLKDIFDRSLEKLLLELSVLNVDNVNGFIPSPSIEERKRINEYFIILQI